MNGLRDEILASYSWACHYAQSCTANFSNHFDREELKSVGLLGYMVAANRFDENKGSSFRGFCAKRIRGAIMDELRRSTWEPRSARRDYQVLNAKTLELEAKLQRKPTSAELADALDISETELAQMQAHAQPAQCVSLDEPGESSDGGESRPLREILPDQATASPFDAMELAEIRRNLCACISKLPPAEASVIVHYYLRNTPFHEIAEKMKLTPSRISQLHHHALGSLKNLMAKKDD